MGENSSIVKKEKFIFNYKFKELKIINNWKRFLNLAEFTKNSEDSREYKRFFDDEKSICCY